MLSVSKYLQLIEICVIFYSVLAYFFFWCTKICTYIEMFLFKGHNIIVWNFVGVEENVIKGEAYWTLFTFLFKA